MPSPRPSGTPVSWEEVQSRAASRRAEAGKGSRSSGKSSSRNKSTPVSPSSTASASTRGAKSVARARPNVAFATVTNKRNNASADVRVLATGASISRVPFQDYRFGENVQNGDQVVVGFVDRDPKKPFIVGHGGFLGSGVSTGSESRALAWHNGVAGTPNYTGSRYVLDTGYRPWKLDAGWSIPGPWNAIIGYTVDQGYILTVRGRQVRCYRAGNGALAWSWDLATSGAKPVYNPARREVVFLRQASVWTHVDVILDAVTGAVVGGPTAWLNMAARDLEGVYIWGDWIYDLRPTGGYAGQFPFPFQRYRRDGPSGYTLEGAVTLAHPFVPGDLGGEGLYWAGLTRATPDGLVPYTVRNIPSSTFLCRMERLPSYEYWTVRIYGGPGYSPDPTLLYDRVEEHGGWYTFYRNSIGEAHQHYRFGTQSGCMGLLDLGSGISSVRDAVQPPPFSDPAPDGRYTYWFDHRHYSTDYLAPNPDRDFPPHGVTHYLESNAGMAVYGLMAADGDFYGNSYWQSYEGSTETGHSDEYRSWTAKGVLRAVSPLRWIREGPASGGRAVASSEGWHVIGPEGSILWSLPDGASFTGHGGETVTGDNAWVLTTGEGGYKFRNFKTGAVLGEWTGNKPVMVSAGVIYDTDGDGNLRRWTA